MKNRPTFRRTTSLAVLSVFVFSGVFGLAVLSAPRVAQAQSPAGTGLFDAPNFGVQTTKLQLNIASEARETAVDTSKEAKDTARTVEQAKQGIWDRVIKPKMLSTLMMALLDASNYFAQRIAYDTATWISSGDKGQKPLFNMKSIGSYLGDVARDAAGEAIGRVSDDLFEDLGINLCSPTSPKIALNIKLGFLNNLPGQLGGPISDGQPKPRCSWNNISSNWSEFSKLDTDQVLSKTGIMFSRGQNSLSTALEFQRYSMNNILSKQTAAVNEYIAKAGWKDRLSRISGRVETPAEVIKEEFNMSLEQAYRSQDRALDITLEALAAGGWSIAGGALRMFTNTLAENYMNRLLKVGLLSPFNDDPADPYSFLGDPPGSGGRAAAELANASLLTPKILTSTNRDELTDFAICPDESRTLDNCVMDQKFYNGVIRSSTGLPMTVRQAIDQGFLNGDWRLFPSDNQKDRDKNCYNDAYCHSNLVKLRRARIIPIGWELAADSEFNDPADPITLREVMNGFSNCPVDVSGEFDSSKLPDQAYPWCNLIDPNWILKYPKAICRQSAPGPSLLSVDTAARSRECVDTANCLLEDANGNCVGGYGYCVNEKSFWQFDAETCPGYYASCQTVKRADGREFSYLMNTTKADICNQENAGCREYSTVANAVTNGGFEDVVDGSSRGWTGGSGVDLSGKESLRGFGAMSISGGSVSQNIASVLPSVEYAFSASALGRSSGIAATTVSLRFLDKDGASLIIGSDSTDCELDGTEEVASFSIAMTDLGYTTASCKATSPDSAVSARVSISSSAPAWVDEVSLSGNSFSSAPLDSIFLNAKTESCQQNQGGCTGLVRASTATLNLLRNPSFEDRNSAGDAPKFWGINPPLYEDGTFVGSDGSSAVRLSLTPVEQEVGSILPNATYSFSVFSSYDGSEDPPEPPVGTARLILRDTSGFVTSPDAISGSCSDEGSATEMTLPVGVRFERVECQFTTPDDIGSVTVSLVSDSDTNLMLADAAQLELAVNVTPFHDGYGFGVETVSLKVAPDGLGCTGSAADPASCSSYAPFCRREEVGCNLYTPVEEGTSVPAITASGDACPSECSGYDTFRQEPTNFKNEEFPLFFIPSTAGSCSAAAAGCEEFTNIEKLSGGGEAREYYSYMRLCNKPDDQTGTFYTWEGNDVEGFQLRTWFFRKSNEVSAPTGTFGSDPTGETAPCTNLRYDAFGVPSCADDSAADNIAACSKIETSFNPDCREFYDDGGNIHYRLYSKTIVSSESCTEYRMTEGEETACRSNGGFWSGSECRYSGLSNESRSCSSASVGCRAYTGNASRNVRIVISDTFESGTTDGWLSAPAGDPTLSVVNSNESVTAGGRSLKSANDVITKDVSSVVRKGKSYLLTFWARGKGDLDVRFSDSGDVPFTYDKVSSSDVSVALSTEWNVYTLGPVDVISEPASDFSDPAANEQLEFRSSASSPLFFIDNIELKEVSESVYLIKDSWNTPASCDETPEGVAAPQYMLGCKTYTDKDEASVTLKSFSRLCSERAVGCEALYDTENSDSPFGETYNAVCTLPDGPDAGSDPDACVPSGSVNCDCNVGTETVCQVAPGSTECRYDTDESVDDVLTSSGGHVSPIGDTVRVRGDKLVYLVNDKNYGCSSENIGCSSIALRTLDQDGNLITGWESKYVLNDPDRYTDTLCIEKENFCQAYTRKTGGTSVFFKDPGNKTCEYRENVFLGNFVFNGWFKNGLDEPCYADNLKAGNLYGIWKNSDSKYEGRVGLCTAQYDQCKEFVDPLDTSEANPEGQPYYAILNDRLDVGTCQNQASLVTSPRSAKDASACVLFDRTDDLTKRFDAQATYAESDFRNGALVDVISSASNTTNVVIKVKRDRRCSEWLDCRSSEAVFNQSSGTFQNVCTSFGICNKFEKVGDSTQCVQYKDSVYSGDVLTAARYQSRNTGRQGSDFAGFSVPGLYPVDELVTMDISNDTDEKDMRLVYIGGVCDEADGAVYGNSCGSRNDTGNRGTCLGKTGSLKCVWPVDGSKGLTGEDNLNLDYWNERYLRTDCRAYPQEDSPFPSTVADPGGWDSSAGSINNGNPFLISAGLAFESANVCQRRIDPDTGREYESCECAYQIGKYSAAGEKFFSLEDSNLPAGYCQGGEYDGYECDPRALGVRSEGSLSCCTKTLDLGQFGGFSAGGSGGCIEGGQCQRLSKVNPVIGYQGQCLERDNSTLINNSSDQFACNTWRPVGIVGGTRDIYNLNQTAGYFAPLDRRFYCNGTQGATVLNFNIDGSCAGEADCPTKQPTSKFFGPGKVVNAANIAGSQDVKCEDNKDGQWCVWPGLSTANDVRILNSDKKEIKCTAKPDKPYKCYSLDGESLLKEGRCVNIDESKDPKVGVCVYLGKRYFLKKNAIGILGCYEVAAGGSTSSTYIDYPYIGSPVYKPQLQSIYFQVSDDLYDRSNPANGEIDLENRNGLDKELTAPTNPLQEVWKDCNDEGNDNIDSEIKDNIDTQKVRNEVGGLKGRDLIEQSPYAFERSYVFLDEENKFQTDPSDGQGDILLRAEFDSFDRLKSIRVAASDNTDSGAFGLNRMGFVFKPGCSSIARVDVPGEFGLTKAITDIVNPYADYVGTGPDLRNSEGDIISSLGSSCSPWGAIGNISSEPSSVPWTFITTHDQATSGCVGDAFLEASGYEDLDVALGDFDLNILDTIRLLFRKVTQAWDFKGIWNRSSSQDWDYRGYYSDIGDGAAFPDSLSPIAQEDLYAENLDKAYDDSESIKQNGKYSTTVWADEIDGDGNLPNEVEYQSPRVASVSAEGCVGDVCPVGDVDTITVNGKSSGILTAQDGVFSARAEFYAWASHNAMPILRRRMIWGDFTPDEPPGKGWYKNSKPFCSSGTLDSDAVGECGGLVSGRTCIADSDCPGVAECNTDESNHFGNTPGACEARPARFQHTYTCSVKDLTSTDICDGPDEAADNAPCKRKLGSGNDSWVCVYQPSVQIKDNWDWCNCTGSDCDLPTGAYNDACELNSATAERKPWTAFDGEIRVQPKIKDVKAYIRWLAVVESSGVSDPEAGGGSGGGSPFKGAHQPSASKVVK